MFATRLLLFIGVFCFSSVFGERVVCDFKDSECMTEAINLTFEDFVAGKSGVEPSDPLIEKHIEAKLPTLSYTFFDAKLAGLKKCRVELVEIAAKEYKYYLGCPHLTMEAQYEINGDIGPQHIEGKGDCKVDFYDYHLQFHGEYTTKAGQEGKTYLNLKTHELQIVVKGKVVYDFKNLFNGDEEKSEVAHKYVNENWKAVDELSREPAMIAFGDNIIDHVNFLLDKVPMEEMFSQEK